MTTPIYRTAYGNVGATYRRNLINWVLPDTGVVSMFINPANISINRTKDIKADKTKGGFVIQYFGESLVDISITGTTGSFGIEGINVLEDIYRNEQLVFDYHALNAQADYETETGNWFADFFAPTLGEGIDLASMFGDSEMNSPFSSPKPSLAYYASAVEMHYGAATYHGFFTSFNVTESSDTLGWFNYDLKFKATLLKGRRPNFMPWHRSPEKEGKQINSSADYASSLTYPKQLGYLAK